MLEIEAGAAAGTCNILMSFRFRGLSTSPSRWQREKGREREERVWINCVLMIKDHISHIDLD